MIVEYEEKIKLFEETLKRRILGFFEEKEKSSTHEIKEYCKSHFPEFKELSQKFPRKALHRLKKILETLEKEGKLNKVGLTGIKGRAMWIWKKVNNQK
jgi:hypothetical protein